MLMDVDTFGDSLANTGYVVQEHEGQTIARVVKVDPGFVFSFWSSENRLRNTRMPSEFREEGSRVLSDQRDIQYSSYGSAIRWSQFSPNQQTQFRTCLRQGIAGLREQGVVEYLYTRQGAINSGADETEALLRPDLVNKYIQGLLRNLELQESIYLSN